MHGYGEEESTAMAWGAETVRAGAAASRGVQSPTSAEMDGPARDSWTLTIGPMRNF